MDTTSRQEMIDGWNQSRLQGGHVVIVGRTHVACQTAWGVLCMGVGRVTRLGAAKRSTVRIDRWLSGMRLHGAQLCDHAMQVEFDAQLDWALGSDRTSVLVIATEKESERRVCRSFADRHRIPWIAATASGGGWISRRQLVQPPGGIESVVVAQAIGALVVDEVRRILCPLRGDGQSAEGRLGWRLTASDSVNVWQAGVGGIGVFSAFSFAALGWRQHLIDSDRVEPSNLNRQGLFRQTDAEKRSPKSIAARRTLQALFPSASITAEVRRVDRRELALLRRLENPPDVLVSALDNAESRLIVGRLGQAAAIPVVQGGTGTFSADCFVQLPGGPNLNTQLQGALAAALERERSRVRDHGCTADPSYVVPSMICGAMTAYRVLQIGQEARSLPPIRWRSGCIPMEDRSANHGQSFANILS